MQDEKPQKEALELEKSRLEDVSDGNLFVNITKALSSGDSREDDQELEIANQKEIDGIEARNLWCPVPTQSIPTNANILSIGFFLAYKNYGPPKQTFKSRYVAQGHSDRDKGRLFHSIHTLRANFTRIVVSVAAVKGYRIFRDDIKQAYLQNDHQINLENLSST